MSKTSYLGKISLFLGTVLASTLFGAYQTFAVTPDVRTVSASYDSATETLTFSGSYDTFGAGGATAWFRYGTTSSLGNDTLHTSYVESTRTITASISGVTAGAQYFYQAFATNSTTGPGYGTTKSYTIPSASMPTAQTMSATTTSNTATLKGYFNGNGASAVETSFRWGTNGSSTSTLSFQTPWSSQSSTYGNFYETITGLTAGKKYYFQAVVKTVAGTTYASGILPFTTDISSMACNPSLTADTYSVTSGGSTTLRLSTNGCGNITIDSSNGTYNDTPVSGSSITTGTLTTNTNFTVSGMDLAGVIRTSDPITITVTGGGSTATCRIYSFSHLNSSITRGSSDTLTWNTTGCDSGYIDNGVGNIYPISNGSVSVSPSSSTTYTLYAYKSGMIDPETASTTVSVTSGGGWWWGNTTQDCSVTSLNSSAYSVNPGESATLTWNSYGCNYITISNINGGRFLYSSGSNQTGPLYYTTTFSAYGYGQNGNTVGPSITIFVSGNNQQYYPPIQNTTYNQNASVITSVATNIGGKTARLNGIITSTYPVNSFFEYGTNPNTLISTSEKQMVSGNVMNYYATIPVSPLTTYYFRAVSDINGNLVKGAVVSFDTASANSPVSNVYATTNTRGTGNTLSGIELIIKNNSDKVAIGETLEYTIEYKNNSGSTLRNTTLSILFPQGYTLKQSSQGRMISPNTMEVDLGTIASGSYGSVYSEVVVGQGTPINQTLLTTGTLNYTLPNGTRDSTVGYILNHANGMSALGGFALGSGFFPTTLFGWFLTIIVIFAIILAARRLSRGGGGHGHGGHH